MPSQGTLNEQKQEEVHATRVPQQTVKSLTGGRHSLGVHEIGRPLTYLDGCLSALESSFGTPITGAWPPNNPDKLDCSLTIYLAKSLPSRLPRALRHCSQLLRHWHLLLQPHANADNSAGPRRPSRPQLAGAPFDSSTTLTLLTT